MNSSKRYLDPSEGEAEVSPWHALIPRLLFHLKHHLPFPGPSLIYMYVQHPRRLLFITLVVASMQFMLVQWSGSTSFTRPLISNTEPHMHGVRGTPDIYMFRSFTPSPLSSVRESALSPVLIGASEAYVYAFNFSPIHTTNPASNAK